MGKVKGIGGKKHRRGKNLQQTNKIDIPDSDQYFGIVIKSFGCGKVNLQYFIPKKKHNGEIEWETKEKVGVIRGKMLRRIFVNINDIVLVTEREFDDKKVDIISKFTETQLEYIKNDVLIPNISSLYNKDNEVTFTNDISSNDISSGLTGDNDNDSLENENTIGNIKYYNNLKQKEDKEENDKL